MKRSLGYLCIALFASQPMASLASDLDLSSTAPAYQSTDVPGANGAVIVQGGHATTLGSSLTAAQYVAFMQSTSPTGQQLVLNGQGAATGGSVRFDTIGAIASSIAIPQGVTALNDFGAGALHLTGNFINSGTFYAASSSQTTSMAAISALNIINGPGALLSSFAPQNLLATFNLAPSGSPLGLNLIAAHDIVNSGTITASTLNLAAGGSIINNAGAIMQSINTSTLMANAIANAGLIQSVAGNININTVMPRDLLVNNVAGILSAAGAINIRDSLVTEKINTTLWGGTLNASELNIFSGNGAAVVVMDEINATVNVNSGSAVVQASNGSLTLGNIVTSGDPVFYNTNGNIVIRQSITSNSPSPLYIVASGDIVTSPDNGPISITTGGGELFMLAGANFTSNLASQDQPPPTGSGALNVTLTINGASQTGGSIDLQTTAPIATISTRGAGTGGEVRLLAMGGNCDTCGTIRLPGDGIIRTGGNGAAFDSGNVTIIGSSRIRDTVGISVGAVDTTGGKAGTGAVRILTSALDDVPFLIPQGFGGGEGGGGGFGGDPFIPPPPPTVNITVTQTGVTGTLLDGVVRNNHISTGGITTTGAAVDIRSGGQLQVNGAIDTSSTVGAAGTVNVQMGFVNSGGYDLEVGTNFSNAYILGGIIANGLSPSTISINNVNGGINLSGTFSFNNPQGGGTINLTSGTSTISFDTIDVSSTTGAGGTVTINTGDVRSNTGGPAHILASGATSGGKVTVNQNFGFLSIGSSSQFDTTIDIRGTGPNADAGTLNLTSGNMHVDTTALQLTPGTNGKGATVNLTAPSFGNIAIDGDLNISGQGNGDGGHLNITMSKFGSTFVLDPNAAVLMPNGIRGNIIAQGGTTSGAGGSFKFTGAGISVPPGGIDVSATEGNGGIISLTGTNLVDLSSLDTIDVSAAGNGNHNGGSLTFSSNNVALVSSGPVTLMANGSGNGNAGSITIQSTITDLVVGKNPGEIIIQASALGTSGDAGSLSLSSTNRSVVVDTSAISLQHGSLQGAGGKVSLDGQTRTAWVGPVDLSGAGTGAGGSFKLNHRGLNLIIGNTLSGASGVEGAINVSGSTGGTIDITTNRQIDFNVVPGQDLLDAHGTTGDGGKITILGTDLCCFISRPAVFSDLAPVVFNASGATNGGAISLQFLGGGTEMQLDGSKGALVILNASGANGNGGSVSVKHIGNQFPNGGQINIGTAAGADNTVTYNINVAGGGAVGNGGQVTAIALTDITVDVSGLSTSPGASGNGARFDFQTINPTAAKGQIIGDLDAAGRGSNGSGGFISLTNSQGDFTAGNLIANGSGSGAGGEIKISNTNGNNTLTAGIVSANGGVTGNGGKLQIASKMNVTSLSADGGTTSGNAGTAIFTSNNALVFDPSTVSLGVTRGNGGTLILTGSDVFVNGDVNLDSAGAGGTFDGGSLTITATSSSQPFVLGGAGNGVNGIDGTVSLNAATGFGNGGKFTLSANRADVQLTGGQSLSADGGTFAGNGGAIDITANSFTVSGTGAFLLTANAKASTGSGGSISVTNAANTNAFDPVAMLNIGTGDGQIALAAHAGSFSGDGGKITVVGGHSNVLVDAAGIDAHAGASVGNGAQIKIAAGFAEQDGSNNYILKINGNLNADSGIAGGDGGIIALSYNAQSNSSLSIGAASPDSYINGTLSAKGAVNGGLIQFRNTYGPSPNSKQTGGTNVNFFVTTKLDASGGTGKAGTIDFNNYEVLDIDIITGRATVREGFIGLNFDGNAALNGKVSIQGAGLDVSSSLPGFTINVARIEALDGSANISLTGAGSTLIVQRGNTLVDISSIGSLSGSYYPIPDPLPFGVIASSQNLTISVANLQNDGEIVAGSGFPLQSSINNLNSLSIINGTNTGNLTVSGRGNLFARDISIANFNGKVLVNQGAIVGTVSGSSSDTFTLNSTVYGLTVNQIDAGGQVDINANGGILTLFTSVNTSSGGINMTGFSGVNINSSAFINGAGAITITSTRGTDSPYFFGPLGVMIGDSVNIGTGTGNVTIASQRFGGIQIGNQVNINADAGALAITNSGLNPTTFGTNGFFNAKGGNLDVIATNSSINVGQDSSFNSSNTVTLSANNSSITFGDNPVITAGDDIGIYGNASVNLAQGNQVGGLLIAGRNISITSLGNIDIGSRIIGTAGSLNTDPTQSVLQPGDIARPGNVIIDAYMNGQGTGNISVGCCTTFTANGGDISVTARETINGQGSIWQSYGGVVGFSAGFDIDLTNATVQSIGRLTGGAPNVFTNGDSSAGYVGGAVIFQVGLLSTPLATTYAAEKNLRQFNNTVHYQLGSNVVDFNDPNAIVGYSPSPEFPTGNVSDSGRIYVSDPTVSGGALTTLQYDFTNTTLEGRGGTVFIDPPPNIGILNFAGANILAVAPPAVQGAGGPPIVPPFGPPGGPGGVIVLVPLPPGTTSDEVVIPITANVSIKSTIILQTDTITEQATVPRDEPQMCAAPVQLSKGGEPDKNPAGTWAVAAATCQIFAVKEEDASVLAAGGTTVASAKGGMAMKEGKMLVMTGQNRMSVFTPVGAVSFPPESCAIIEGKSSGVLRVTPLSGGDATVTIGEGEKIERITTAGGREIIIASNDVDDEELIPTDGVDRITVSARVALADVENNKPALKIRENKFSKHDILAKDPLLNCRECMGQMKKRVAEMAAGSDIIEKPKASRPRVDNMSHYSGPSTTDGTNGHLLPVGAFKSTLLASARPKGLRSMTFDGVSIHSQSAKVSYDSQIVNLSDGEAMVVADKPAVVRLSNGAIAQFNSGTIAMIYQEGEKSFIQVLHDSRSASVNVRVGGKVVKLSCGQELVVTKEKPGNILKSNPIGRRRVQSMPASKTHHMMLSEISLPSLLMHSAVFTSLSLSHDDHDKQTTGKILKTAAALGVASGGHGQYSRY